MIIPVFLCNDVDSWYLLIYNNVLLIGFEFSHKTFKSHSSKDCELGNSLKSIFFPARDYLPQSVFLEPFLFVLGLARAGLIFTGLQEGAQPGDGG